MDEYEAGMIVLVSAESKLPLALFASPEVDDTDLFAWLQPYEILYIKDGPRRKRSMIFWQVESLDSKLIGWVSQGLDRERFIEPVFPCQHCARALPSRVRVGAIVRVVGANFPPLAMRQTPEPACAVHIETLFSGEEMTIIEGPVYNPLQSYCIPFWKVRLADNTVGWVAECDHSDYWLEPVDAIAV